MGTIYGWLLACSLGEVFCTLGGVVTGLGRTNVAPGVGGVVGMVSLGCAVMDWKISVSCLSARSCVLPMVAKGGAGVGLRKAWVRIFAAIMAALVEDICGIWMSDGKNYMVSVMHSCPVLEQ